MTAPGEFHPFALARQFSAAASDCGQPCATRAHKQRARSMEPHMRVRGIPTEHAGHLRAGGGDANGQAPQVIVAEGGRYPCRHCLGLIAEGDEVLVLSYRPFAAAQPYAETGPIFLHKKNCARYDGEELPAWFVGLDPAAIRGYDARDWIRYDTGRIVRGPELASACESLLSDASVAYAHIRSKFGCFQCHVERA
jgi:hypothetical protein